MRTVVGVMAVCCLLGGCQEERAPAAGGEDGAPAAAPAQAPTTEPAAAEQRPPPEQAEMGQFETEALRVTGDVVPPKRVSRGTLGLETLEGRFVQGLCVLSAVISREGAVQSASVIKPDELDPEIRRLLVASLRSWRFEPATLEGQPVAVHYSITVNHCPLRRVEGAV